MKKGFPRSSKHNPIHVGKMQYAHAGAYALDRRTPASMDLPDCCAFGKEANLLNQVPYYLGHCGSEQENIVVQDIYFGSIPVCQAHKYLILKEREEMRDSNTRVTVTPNRARTAVNLAWRHSSLGYVAPQEFFKKFGKFGMTIRDIKELAARWKAARSQPGFEERVFFEEERLQWEVTHGKFA